ncbi:MAG: hypothetical protein QOD86_15 [Miltoncostaeaceae bacterium]|nr:hypothetical protein [Miltoncostaeaceae bacterium]
MITFRRLEALSFLHSGAYCGLLAAWLIPGAHGAEHVLGWIHGLGWIGMSLLCLHAVRARIIPLWLGAMVIIVGGVGPFAGTAAFVHEDRRRSRASRGMV